MDGHKAYLPSRRTFHLFALTYPPTTYLSWIFSSLSNFLNFPKQYLLILPFMEQRQEQVLQNPFRFLDAAAREVTTALARSHIRHGFIGGYATSLIGGVRMTSVRLFLYLVALSN
jgi:hypothetical protein